MSTWWSGTYDLRMINYIDLIIYIALIYICSYVIYLVVKKDLSMQQIHWRFSEYLPGFE